MDKKERELLEQADWDDMIPKLLKHALNKLRRRFFFSNSTIHSTKTEQIAQDQVIEAIVKLWDETVSWDYEKKDNLLYFLQGVINSQISHLFDDKEYLTTERFPVVPSESTDEHIEVEQLLKRANPHEDHAGDITPTVPPDPQEALLIKEQEARDKSVTDALLERLKGDKELEDIVLCIMGGTTKPREIAEEMRAEVKHVYNLQKKLRRVYKDLLEQARKEKR